MRYLCTLIALFSVASGRPGDDVKFSEGYDTDKSPFRNAIKDYNKRYPDGYVPYEFDGNWDPKHREVMIQRMNQIRDIVSTNRDCIRFVNKIAQHVNFLTFKFDSSSICGITNEEGAGKIQITINDSCLRPRTIIQFIMQGLGFRPEHNRYDRDNYVTVLKDSPQFQKDFDTITQDIPYDYGSVTHGISNLVPKGDAFIGGRRALLGMMFSKSDVERIQKFYNCTRDETPFNNEVASKRLVVDCTFENGLCGLTKGSETNSFDWETTKAPAGQTSSRGNYLVANAANHQGQVAILKGPTVRGCHAISFAYKVDKIENDNLVQVSVRYSRSTFDLKLSDVTTTSGNHWTWTGITDGRSQHKGFNHYHEIRVTIGRNHPASVAIDNIIIRPC